MAGYSAVKPKQTNTNTIVTQAYHSRWSSWKLSSTARIAWDFSTRIQQGEKRRKRKRCHPKSHFRIWQAAHFSTKNSINKPVMNKRRLLIAAVFHFMHPVEKDSKKHHKLTKNSVSFSCQSKQDSRCCINFPHELTCQILTNQSIKNGRRAWPTSDYGEKGEKHLSSLLVFLNNWLNFRVRDHFEIKMLIARGHSDIQTTPSVIMSLFCCRSLCFCISLSRCLCPFILALSRSAWRCSWLEFSLLLLALTRSVRGVSSLKFSLFALTLFFCLPAFFTEIFSVCSNPVSFCLPAFFAEIFSVWSEIFSVCSCPVSFYLPTLFAKILSSSSTSNALSLAIVFACSTPVHSCSLLSAT